MCLFDLVQNRARVAKPESWVSAMMSYLLFTGVYLLVNPLGKDLMYR